MTDTAQQITDYQRGDIVAGRYVLDKALGEGGMGIVWVARSIPLDVDVALKMLRREAVGTESSERMAREARTLAQLGHPAMVRVLDFGSTERKEPFIAMELLRGDALSTLLERHHRLAPVRSVALLLPIIDGLGTAHDKGIVHRDIKPENIFIARDEQGRIQPKLLDFGIAKHANSGPAISRLTEMGVVLGSPQYLSPEQAEGLDEIDFRADIWAIGVVLYELVTGAAPFGGKNYNALMRSIQTHQPNDFRRLGVGDAQLWTIVDRCLKKVPRLRWNSMWELGEALALWLYEHGERIDASSRSLKDGWLSGHITGLRVLTSDAPDSNPIMETVRPDVLATPLAVPEIVAPVISEAKPPDVRTAQPTVLRNPRREQRLLFISAGIAVAIVLLGVFLLVGRGNDAPAVSAAPTPHEAPPPVATPPTPVQPATVAAPQAAPPAEAPSAAETKPAAAIKPVTAATKPAPSADKPAAAPKVPARPRPKKTAIDTEFGF